MTRRHVRSVAAVGLAVLSLVGISVAQYSPTFPYDHTTASPKVALSMCSGPLTRGWECNMGNGICILVEQQQCAQNCWDANGHPTIRPDKIKQVGCFDS